MFPSFPFFLEKKVVKFQKFGVLISEKPYMIISQKRCNADSEMPACVFLCTTSILWWSDFVTNGLSGKFDYRNQNQTFHIVFCKYKAQELKMPMNTF